MTDAPTEIMSAVGTVDDTPAGRFSTDSLRWLTTPLRELWALTDTQPIPQFPTTDPDSEKQAELDRARDVALGRPSNAIDPRDPMHLELILRKLREWTPKPKNPQEPRNRRDQFSCT